MIRKTKPAPLTQSEHQVFAGETNAKLDKLAAALTTLTGLVIDEQSRLSKVAFEAIELRAALDKLTVNTRHYLSLLSDLNGEVSTMRDRFGVMRRPRKG